VRRTTGLEDGKSGDKTVAGTEALATEAAARMEDSIGDVKRTGQSVVRRGESVVERQQECRGARLGYASPPRGGICTFIGALDGGADPALDPVPAVLFDFHACYPPESNLSKNSSFVHPSILDASRHLKDSN
jgi:hypothetical protein